MDEIAKRDHYRNLLSIDSINRQEYKVLFTFLIADEKDTLFNINQLQKLSSLEDGSAVISLHDKGYLEMIGGKYKIKEKENV